MASDAIIGDAYGYPNGTQLVLTLADHVHDPNLVGVTNRERFALAGIAILGYQVGHHLDGLAGSFGTLQGNVDEAAVVNDGFAVQIPQFLTSAPGALTDGHLVLVHVTHDSIGVCHLGDGTQALAAVPVNDFAHRAGCVVGSGQILEVTVQCVAVGGIGNDGRAIGTGVLAHQQVSAGIGCCPCGESQQCGR